jgi:hypothetical protein
MSIVLLGVLATIGGLLAIAIWLTRRSDSTVANRMRSPSRPDGTRDPRAYTHHSSY